MPGYWEYRQANQVGCVILHTDHTSMKWSFGLRNLIIPGREELRRFDPFIPVAGQPFDRARDNGTAHFLNLGAEWVFHYDSDVVPPRDVIPRLMAHNLPIVSGMYSRRSPPHAVPVMMKDGQWITKFKPGSMVEADVVGAGCLLLRRDFLERLPPIAPEQGLRWFAWKCGVPNLPAGEATSEDYSLCIHARKTLGVKVYVDTSVECGHVGLAESRYGQFFPAEVRTQT